MHSDQWRYDRKFSEMCPVADKTHPIASGHTADKQALAVRCGWLPCYPQFTEHNFELVQEAKARGVDPVDHVVSRLKDRSPEVCDGRCGQPGLLPARVVHLARQRHPGLGQGARVLSQALPRHAPQQHRRGARAADVKEVTWHDKLELGKMDLIVDLNFRMDTSALYSDIVLPAASWYEKDDLSSTDMHSFIHPLQAAVPPCWESKSDWKIFRAIAQATSEMARAYLPESREGHRLLAAAARHRGEIAQPTVKDWAKGECEAIPGKTMPNMKVVERDYTKVYQKFISLGRNFRNNGLGLHGTTYPVDDLYDAYLKDHPSNTWGGEEYPSLRRQEMSARRSSTSPPRPTASWRPRLRGRVPQDRHRPHPPGGGHPRCRLQLRGSLHPAAPHA
jgi:nitrate reductase alpha subunit